MSEEKEIKVRVLEDLSIDEIKTIIQTLFEVKFDKNEQDKDIYYDLQDDFYFKLNHGIRIRNDSKLAYKALFFIPEKKLNPWFVLEKEYKLPMSKVELENLFKVANIKCDAEISEMIDINELKQILQKLQFVEKIKIEKNRWSAKNRNYEICIDSVNHLGVFVEIEVKEDLFLEHFRNRLSFDFEEIRHGYTELYAKQILKIKVPDFKQNFIENSDWNYLAGQKELVMQILNKR
jgi:adenylate cyclase class IV